MAYSFHILCSMSSEKKNKFLVFNNELNEDISCSVSHWVVLQASKLFSSRKASLFFTIDFYCFLLHSLFFVKSDAEFQKLPLAS